VVKAALRATHGRAVIEENLSEYHLMTDVAVTYVGMEIAVPDECWDSYQEMPPEAFANVLTKLAGQVKLSRYPKKKRGPKKPRPARKSAKQNHHIATSRVLAKRREKRP
jgi:hypothetical protein